MKLRVRPTNDLESQLTFDAILRNDFLAFAQKCFYTIYPNSHFLPNWHHLAIAAALLECTAGIDITRRLLINLPPRHMKSELVSIIFTAWLLAKDPTCTIISVSYGDDLVRKFSRLTRKIMMSAWYQRVFPRTRLSTEKCTETELETTLGGSRRATTVRGEILGHGADYIVIDDPHPVGAKLTANVLKATAEWYSEELVSRLTHRGNGVVIVVMQRAKPNDLAGYLLQGGMFRQLKLPLIAVEKEKISLGNGLFYERKIGEILHPAWRTARDIEEIKLEISPAVFEAQYQQDPKPNGGSLFNLTNFSRFGNVRPRNEYEYVLQCWDCASSLSEIASYSVCITFGVRAGKLYVLDVWRGRLEYPNLRRKAHELVDKFVPTHIVVEYASVGQSLFPDLREKYGSAVFRHDTSSDKVSRAEAVLRHVVDGMIALPREAPFLLTLSEEISAFPNGFYDDQVDCIVMALYAVRQGVFRRRGIDYRSLEVSASGYNVSFSPDARTQGDKGRRLKPGEKSWSAKKVSDDIRARIHEIENEPPWQKERSEYAREWARDSRSARLRILNYLNQGDILATSSRFFSALRKLRKDTSGSHKAFDAKDYAEVHNGQLDFLLRDYDGARW